MSSPARLARKIGVSVLGFAVLALGVALLVLPGPGALVILLGLLILGSEYEWASRRLDVVKDKVLDSADNAARSPFQLATGVLGALALIAAGVVWGLYPSLPAGGWTTGATIIFSGVLAGATLGYSVYRVKSGAADRTPDESFG